MIRPTAWESKSSTRALVAATNALIPYALSPREPGSRREAERTLARLVEILIRGL
jgi:hypothetical protein